MSFLAEPAPRWFNIEAGRPFLEDLARGLTAALAPLGPPALAAATVLTPTRRAGRDLADALAGFLDSVQIEEAEPLAKIDDLAPGELARHWQVSAEFLKLALAAWPKRLGELGLMDVGERRVQLLRRLAERWRAE